MEFKKSKDIRDSLDIGVNRKREDFDYPGFFDWLRTKDKIDYYEAALDVSEDFDSPYRTDAANYIQELKMNYWFYLDNLKLNNTFLV